VPKPNEPPGIYLDSSVLIAYLSREIGPAGHPRWWHVFKIIQNAARTNGLLLVSAMTIAEVTGDRGRPDYADKDRQDRFRRFLRHPFFELVELDRNVGSTAREILWAIPGLPPADAIHLAAAIESGCAQMLSYDDVHILPLSGKPLPVSDKEHDRAPKEFRALTIARPMWHEPPVQRELFDNGDEAAMVTIEYELHDASDEDLDDMIDTARSRP
jgi:predicted nucleic acid-binding protein